MSETFASGNTAQRTNTERQLLVKILNVLNAGGGGGGGGGAGTFSGSGSPEGVVTGVPGNTYWDTLNRIEYVKDTGTGNTGWQNLVGL